AALKARSRSSSVTRPSASRSATLTAVWLLVSVSKCQILRQHAQTNNRRLRSLALPRRNSSILCGSSHVSHVTSSTPSPSTRPAADTTPDAACRISRPGPLVHDLACRTSPAGRRRVLQGREDGRGLLDSQAGAAYPGMLERAGVPPDERVRERR